VSLFGKINDTVPMYELAMEYVLALQEDTHFDVLFNMHQRMLGRCGDHANKYIDRALEIYQLTTGIEPRRYTWKKPGPHPDTYQLVENPRPFDGSSSLPIDRRSSE
jgi:hypothetical protein